VVAAWFRYACQYGRAVWGRGSGARPCACARVVAALTASLLCFACNGDADTHAGQELVRCGEVGPLRSGWHNGWLGNEYNHCGLELFNSSVPLSAGEPDVQDEQIPTGDLPLLALAHLVEVRNLVLRLP
jgi:hypothetical protein